MSLLSTKFLEQAKSIVLKQLQHIDCKVYLFGSRATNKAGKYSDIDIALLPKSKLPAGTTGLVKESLEESNIPYLTDVIDLSNTDEEFRKRVLSEGILWKDWKNES